MMTQVRQLVCEGRCGQPHTARYDEALGKGHKDLAMMIGLHLVHTSHVRTLETRGDGHAVYRCLDCDTTRIY